MISMPGKGWEAVEAGGIGRDVHDDTALGDDDGGARLDGAGLAEPGED